MQFEWDEDKNRLNIAKHGVSFEQAQKIFDGWTYGWLDERFEYGEVREISLGMVDGAAILVVVHTEREGVCRIISARPALGKEIKIYEKEIRKTFDH
ncbi:MAG: membrane protein [Rhizobiaceae bacterium MnEN-MB40S]|nr:MAG: membrane protein [Rhizobiaceae bacterium MnEN-MB40S]